jgi:hypothetical protein
MNLTHPVLRMLLFLVGALPAQQPLPLPLPTHPLPTLVPAGGSSLFHLVLRAGEQCEARVRVFWPTDTVLELIDPLGHVLEGNGSPEHPDRVSARVLEGGTFTLRIRNTSAYPTIARLELGRQNTRPRTPRT